MSAIPTLQGEFADGSKRLDAGRSGDDVPFDRDTLRIERGEFTFPGFRISLGHHYYSEAVRVEQIALLGEPEDFRALGCLVLAGLLDSGDRTSTVIHLPDSGCVVDRLIVEHPTTIESNSADGLVLSVERFIYNRDPVSAYPFEFRHLELGASLPSIGRFGPTDPAVSGYDDSLRRDLVGFGGICASARLGRLLLNMSYPEPDRNEIVLESFPGRPGVSPGSAEIALCLPGSPQFG